MTTLLRALAAGAPPDITLRDRTEADMPFLSQLYAATREEELRPVPWPPEQKRAFLADQFDKQHAHYLLHYPEALWLVIDSGSESIGRMYVQPLSHDIRLMDIALVASARNRGIGTALMRGLLRHADAAGTSVSLHVERFNRAMGLYERLGFVRASAGGETGGYYQLMSRAPAPAAAPATS